MKYTNEDILAVYNSNQDDYLKAAAALGMSPSTAYGLWNGNLYTEVTRHGDPEGLYSVEDRMKEPKQTYSVTYQTLRSPASTLDQREEKNG
jgi:hypothetical protein